MPTPISTRLPDWLDGALRDEFNSRGEGASEGLRRVAEEWWVLENFPSLEFRDGVAGRRASIRGGPDVWEIVQAWQSVSKDEGRLSELFSWVDREAIRDALSYYAQSPAQVDALLREQERIARTMNRAR